MNFFGLVELTRAVLPLIEKSDAGRIVNVSCTKSKRSDRPWDSREKAMSRIVVPIRDRP